ncbi:VOC family protein [Actinoplanes sp. NPDC023714]|uniref:VOC family protein n=1 Tax=Actinoplanes sp. NPDC023714 TaxID=3154322 RepID=UPI0033EF3FAA
MAGAGAAGAGFTAAEIADCIGPALIGLLGSACRLQVRIAPPPNTHPRTPAPVSTSGPDRTPTQHTPANTSTRTAPRRGRGAAAGPAGGRPAGTRGGASRVVAAIVVQVAGCRAACAALTAAGVTLLTAPAEPEWGGEVRAFLRDPDGHLIEINETLQP